MTWKILQGDNRDTLKTLADNSIDAIVTDPPYGIDFLGKAWDANTGALETYQECLRVLKPGGHILAFSAARTYHHLAVTLEQAGFEIRDQIMWIYSSGFPKSQDVGKSIDRAAGKKDPNYGSKKTEKQGNETVGDFSSGARCGKCNRTFNADIIKDCKEEPCGMRYTHQTEDGKTWAGWGTALKPAHEPIALARKPMKGSIAQNCQKWGTGALNIDATRIPYANEADLKTYINNIAGPLERSTANEGDGIKMFEGKVGYKVKKGTVKRLPSAGKRTASFHNATGGGETVSGGDGSPEFEANPMGRFPSNVIGEILQEDYQKYFYCPKVTRKERHTGFDDPNTQGNNHPTVKPIELMKYLIKLITPKGGTVLDPFNGSGSTGCAAVELGYDYIGCELDPKYVEISEKRIEAWLKTLDPIRASGLFEEEE